MYSGVNIMPSNLELAVNAALSQRQAAYARYAAAHPFTMGIDAKRDAAWSEYGFKEEITYHDLYKLYRRGGIAHGAVEKIVTTCWRTKPKMNMRSGWIFLAMVLLLMRSLYSII
jgi:uncharacterized protein